VPAVPVLRVWLSNEVRPAWSVAITALRNDALRHVAPASHTEVLRLLSKRNTDIGNQRFGRGPFPRRGHPDNSN